MHTIRQDAHPELSPEAQALHDAESNLPLILGITVTFHVLALISVSLRTYVRIFVSRIVGWDDYTMIGAMLCSIGGMVTFFIGATIGLGRHHDTMSEEHFKKFLHCRFYYALICANLGLNLVKISICLLLMRFVQQKWYKRFLWGIIIFMIAFSIGNWGIIIFRCFPTSGFWDLKIHKLPTTHCYSEVVFNDLTLWSISTGVTTDILLATLPVHVLWKLRLNRRQKIPLIGVLSLGYVAVGIGIIKVVNAVGPDYDETFELGVFGWGFVQVNVSIIAACMPAIRPLFQYIQESFSSNSRNRENQMVNTRNGYLEWMSSTS